MPPVRPIGLWIAAAKLPGVPMAAVALGIDSLSAPDKRLRHKLSGFDPLLQIQTWCHVGYSDVGPPICLDLG